MHHFCLGWKSQMRFSGHFCCSSPKLPARRLSRSSRSDLTDSPLPASQLPAITMGSFRRPRPRFMSSPVLSDLPRFHATRQALLLSNNSAWNSVQSAVFKVFQGGGLQNNELYHLNESIRQLLKTELGSFICDYFQNQLLSKGLLYIEQKILLYEDARVFLSSSLYVLTDICHTMPLSGTMTSNNQLLILAEMWERFFTEILPTLQAIFYPVQGQELTVRQMALLGFRDLVLLKLPLEDLLPPFQAQMPAAITQMLLVLQGIHEPCGPSKQYCQLERLVEMVVSPYLGNYLEESQTAGSVGSRLCKSRPNMMGISQYGPEIVITSHAQDSSLAPLVEQEGEVYLEKVGGVRRHTIANAHPDLQFITVATMMHAGLVEDPGLARPHFVSDQCLVDTPEDLLMVSPDLNCQALT